MIQKPWSRAGLCESLLQLSRCSINACQAELGGRGKDKMTWLENSGPWEERTERLGTCSQGSPPSQVALGRR